MNVHLLIGGAGTGKTFRCLTALRQCEKSQQAALFIVPDQFTYTADRLLLESPSVCGTRFVRVVSFGRLAHLIATGWKTPGQILSEEGRRLMLRRIVHGLPTDDLGPLAAVRHAPGFVEALALALREVKGIGGQNAADQLVGAAPREGEKIAAFSRVVRAYDEALASADLIDPADWVHQVASRLRHEPGPFAMRKVWIDGFAGFTPEERTLLPAIAGVSLETTVTLCADPDDAALVLDQSTDAAAYGIPSTSVLFSRKVREKLRRPQFLPTLRTAVWLAETCSPGLTVEALDAEPHRFAPRSDLAILEHQLFRNAPADEHSTPEEPTQDAPRPTVTLRRSPSPYHEVTAWARWIDARTRLGGGTGRYRDHAVLVRDLDLYRPIVREIFERYRLPFFIDERRDASAHPLIRLCLSALQLVARGWTRELLIDLLRNPLLELPQEQVDRIENLSLEYGIEYERWLQTDWQLLALPSREAPNDDPTEETPEIPEIEPEAEEVLFGTSGARRKHQRQQWRQLATSEARDAAQRVFPPVRAFTDLWKQGAVPFSAGRQALLELLGELLASSSNGGRDNGSASASDSARLREWMEHFHDALSGSWSDDETGQVAGLLVQTLDLGNTLMGNVPIGAGLFARLLRDGLTGAFIGITPQSLDAVTVAEPRRSRINETECVILGGLTARAFPRMPSEDPLFSDEERERLAAEGFPMAANAALQVEEEPYLFYVACTRARQELLLTGPAISESGAPEEPSSYVAEVRRILDLDSEGDGGDTSRDDLDADPLDDCQHERELGPALARTLADVDEEIVEQVLTQACTALPFAEETIGRLGRYIDRVRNPLPLRLPEDVAAELHPEGILPTSASQLETFGQCPFRHFARYALKLEQRPEPTLTPLSTGSAVHAALEKFFAQRQPAESAEEAAHRIGDIFASLANQDEFRIFQEDPPSAYRWQVTGRDLKLFVQAEHRRLGQSTFQPRAVEVSFGLEPAGQQEIDRVRRMLREDCCTPQLTLPPLELTIPADILDQIDGAPLPAGTILMRGRIDRLDMRMSDKEDPLALVLDYKRTSRAASPEKDLNKGLNLQIATYLLAVSEILGLSPAGGFYYSVSPRPRGPSEAGAEANPLGFMLRGFFIKEMTEAIDAEGHILGKPRKGVYDSNLETILKQAREQILSHGARILKGEIRPRAGGFRNEDAV